MAYAEGRIPDEIHALGARLGARMDPTSSRVLLTQSGTMRSGPGNRAMRFTAKQCIDLDRLAFQWRALTGPLRCISVTDRLSGDSSLSEVRLLGFYRLAGNPQNDAALLKGQIMRYLAELPWAPDAILRNRALGWNAGDGRITVSTSGSGERIAVDFTLDGQGRIESVAANRPRMEGLRFVERPWRGRFFEYRLHHGRWLPFRAEVGWILDGRLMVVWTGEIGTWETA